MRKLLLLLCAGLFVANAYAMEGGTETITIKAKAANDAIDTLKSGVETAVKTLVDKIILAADQKCVKSQTEATATTAKAQEEAKAQVEAAMKAIEDITKALTTAQTEITEYINKIETTD